jgi:hypothetical protein
VQQEQAFQARCRQQALLTVVQAQADSAQAASVYRPVLPPASLHQVLPEPVQL